MSQHEDAMKWAALQGDLLREVDQRLLGRKKQSKASTEVLVGEVEAQIERAQDFLDSHPNLHAKVHVLVLKFIEECNSRISELRQAENGQALAQLCSSFVREDERLRGQGKPATRKQISNRIKKLEEFRDNRDLNPDLLEAVNAEITNNQAELNCLES